LKKLARCKSHETTTTRRIAGGDTVKKEQMLRSEIGRIASRLRAIERRKELRENRKLVGKCFKYHNSYGHGEKWWLYKRILDARGHAHTFEKTSGNEFIARFGSGSYLSDNYLPITRAEFDKAWKGFRKELDKAGGKP
jgi:hypothetical protein